MGSEQQARWGLLVIMESTQGGLISPARNGSHSSG